MAGNEDAQHEEAMRMLRDEGQGPARWTRSVWLRLGLALTPIVVVAVLLLLTGR